MERLFCFLLGVTVCVGAISNERCWEVAAGPLYWKPCGPSFEYGNDMRTGDTRSLSVIPDYDWGVRVSAGTVTHDCCHCWWLDWVYLRTTDGARKTGTSIQAIPTGVTLSNNPLAKASLKYRYNRISACAGRYLASHCKSMAYGFGGLRYVDIQRRETVQVSDLSPGLTRYFAKSEFEGAAFEVGAGVEVEEPWNLYATGRFAALMGIGRRRFEQRSLTTRFHNANETACIAGLEAHVGVEYRRQCRRIWFTIQVNYELDQYFDALRTRNAATPTTTHNVGFAGPGLHIAARF